MIQDDSFWSTERLLPKQKRQSASHGGVPLAVLKNETVGEQRVLARRSYPALRSLYGACLSAGHASSVAAEGMLAEARALAGRRGDPTLAYCPYFSYAPCYAQLEPKQLNSYLCFRDDVAQRHYRAVDYSYLALYLYERLHLLSQENARSTLEELLWIWRSYREDFAVLDKLLADWVTDLCVEWDLPFPFAALDGLLTQTLTPASPILHTLYLFDYLLAGDLCPKGAQVEYLMRCLCDYRYRSVALYRDNALYAASMDGFLANLFEAGFLTSLSQRDEFLSLKIPTRVTLKRVSYPGAILDLPRRRVVAYDYCPLLGDVNVKSRFTSLIKYVDNRIRRRMGMKIKFSSVSIAPVHKQFIDLRFEAYFSTRLREEAPAVSHGPVAEKKRVLQVDLKKASAIESASWKTTDALTKDLYGDEEMVLLGKTRPVAPPPSFTQAPVFEQAREEDVTELCASLDETQTDFVVQLLYHGPAQAKEFSRAKGKFFDHLLSQVNRKAVELLGDVVIEPSGQIVEEYREQLEFLFPKDQYLPFEA